MFSPLLIKSSENEKVVFSEQLINPVPATLQLMTGDLQDKK